MPELNRMQIAVSAAEGGWQARVLAGGELVHERAIARMAGGRGYPFPPAEQLTGLALDDPVLALLTAADEAALRDGELALANPREREIVQFGRYLFEALVGAEAWAAILARADGEPFELALTWGGDEADLHRLPWELMHDGEDFVAARRPRVAITRVVSGAPQSARCLTAPLRTLFVVGAALDDPQIRAGTEYLGLLDRLESRGLTFDSSVVVKANRQLIIDELRRLRPAVVHFICHGRFSASSETQLELMSEERPGEPELFNAEQLWRILSEAEVPPQVVVLNACDTGRPAAGKALPLAAALVKWGVPVVVGMAGTVADRACRMFTTRFYEALLERRSIAAATAEGRRA